MIDKIFDNTAGFEFFMSKNMFEVVVSVVE